MGKRKYHTTVWVIEDEPFLRREILEVLQGAFKRHVLVRTIESLRWALNMDGKPDILILDSSFEPSLVSLRDTAALIQAFLEKFPEVRIGMVGFFWPEFIAGLVKTYPSAEGRVKGIPGKRVSVGMVEFIRQHIDKGTACAT